MVLLLEHELLLLRLPGRDDDLHLRLSECELLSHVERLLPPHVRVGVFVGGDVNKICSDVNFSLPHGLLQLHHLAALPDHVAGGGVELLRPEPADLGPVVLHLQVSLVPLVLHAARVPLPPRPSLQRISQLHLVLGLDLVPSVDAGYRPSHSLLAVLLPLHVGPPQPGM